MLSMHARPLMLDHILDRIRQEGSDRDRDFDFAMVGFLLLMRQSHQISQPKVVHAAGFLFLMETYQTTNAGRVVHADRSRAHVRQCRGGHDPHVEGRASSSRRARITATTSRRAATAADQDREKREPREPVGAHGARCRTTRRLWQGASHHVGSRQCREESRESSR
jgi:hypothetical protein